MWRDLKSRLGCVLLCLALVVPTSASAQGWLVDRAQNEGPGFKLGKKLVLHPGIAFEGGYDNNVFYQDDNRQDSAIIRATAHLDLATRGVQRRTEGETQEEERGMVEFRTGIDASYYHYFIDRVPDNIGGGGDLDLLINPTGIFTTRIHERYKRTIQPFTDPNVPIGETTSYGRNSNAAGVDFLGKSKSQLMQGKLGYTFRNAWFESDEFAYGNNHTHVAIGGASWRFFPSTALLYDIDVNIQNYVNPQDIAAGPSLLTDNTRVNNWVGINGAFTKTFSLTAMVGYAVGFFDLGEDFDGVIGQVEARWKPRGSVTLSGGFVRKYVPSYVGNWNVTNRLFLKTRILLVQRFLIGVEAWGSYDSSGLAIDPAGTPLGNQPRRDGWLVRGSLYLEYRATNWFAVTAQAIYTGDFTDFVYSPPPSGGALLDPRGAFQKIQGWLGVRVFY